MPYIIDRRLNAKNKSTVNRQRFLRRYKKHIKKAVADAVSERSITDIDKGEQISIPSKDVSEPSFHHGKGGYNENIMPGNKEFIAGDHIPRPKGGQGGPGSGASDTGEGMDEFVFQITQEEFLDFMFEELELPNLVKHQLKGDEEFKTHRAGISNEGNPGQVNIVRSLRAANARRLALTGGKRRQIKVLQSELSQLQTEPMDNYCQSRITDILKQIEDIKAKMKRVPWLDNFDLKYNLQVKEPVPRTKAVMFCIMDVSGSMNQGTKDIAKRFFILLYLFLQRNYEHTEVVFIRHHTSASEVDEQEFFYSRETGGTIVSSALILMKEIIDERFPVGEWNIYGAQASDGDNWNDDSTRCHKILTKSLIPLVQFFSYIEITPNEHQALWREYEAVQSEFSASFAMQQIVEVGDIYPVFRALFQKKMVIA
jgi:uncharacterized protein